MSNPQSAALGSYSKRYARIAASVVAAVMLAALTAVVPSAANADPSSTLRAGGRLKAGQQMRSGNGVYRLVMQRDGNLVLRKGNRALWASGTNGRRGAGAVMQGDGNFVIYAGGKARWASNTNGHRGARLVMQNDGNLVIYDRTGKARWATNTRGGGSSTKLRHPLPRSSTTWEYGPGHGGVDYSLGVKDSRANVIAVADGVVQSKPFRTSCVRQSGWAKRNADGTWRGNRCGRGFGNQVVLKHVLSNGTVIYSSYAHLDAVHVSVGKCIARGRAVGEVGNTGMSTGEHLHFELNRGPTPAGHSITPGSRNPAAYIGKASARSICR